MPRSCYVYFPHLFVGFAHDYINAEKSDASTFARSLARASQRHLGISLIR